jgi:hypothetical protein
MMKRLMLLVAMFVFLVWAAGYAAELNLSDGLWEITTSVEMAGIPAGSMPPQKVTQCITKKDAVPQKPDKDQECKMTSNKVIGDTVTWNMQCRMKDGGKIDSDGKVTYKMDTFDGVSNVNMTEPGAQAVKMTQRMSGRRIGECK